VGLIRITYRAFPVTREICRVSARFDSRRGTPALRVIFKCIADITPVQAHLVTPLFFQKNLWNGRIK
jgi:hypothetical protein